MKLSWKSLLNLSIILFTADAGGQYLYLKSYLYGLGIKGAALQMLFEYKPLEFIMHPFVAGPLVLLLVFRHTLYRLLMKTILATVRGFAAAMAILVLLPAGIGYSKGRLKQEFLTTDNGKKVVIYQGEKFSLLQDKSDLLESKEHYTILASIRLDSLTLIEEKIK